MANRTVYITVRLDITNDKVETITDDEVQEVINETDYAFGNVGNFELETEICGQNE
jgi:hypothetical protein